MFFFFKQKTAYEMRISDWSSDVCSSDLAKALLIQTEHWDHLVYGSANCSDDALGLADKAARNAECSIYRRLKAGTGLGALGLDISVPIDRKHLYPQAKQQIGRAHV